MLQLRCPLQSAQSAQSAAVVVDPSRKMTAQPLQLLQTRFAPPASVVGPVLGLDLA
jgi:hypothetical protein